MQRLLRARIAAAQMNTDLEMEAAENLYNKQEAKIDEEDVQVSKEMPATETSKFQVVDSAFQAPEILSAISLHIK